MFFVPSHSLVMPLCNIFCNSVKLIGVSGDCMSMLNENIDTKFELPNKKMTIQLQYSYLIKRIAYYDNLFASKQIIDLYK